MDGVVVIHKPVGPSSFEVVKWVSRALQEKKAGHTGTLDPLASGVLVICLGEATKIISYLMDTQKEYLATIFLGVTTDTDDADPVAKVLFQAEPNQVQSLSRNDVEQAIFSFIGKQIQRPPRFSALKVAGERLYERARQAHSVEEQNELEALLFKKQREVMIDKIMIEDIQLPQVKVRITCSKGTYIRSIARDLGEKLAVGAHLSALQRTKVGVFSVEQAVEIKKEGQKIGFLTEPFVFSMQKALSHLPKIQVNAEIARKLRQGQQQVLHSLPKSEESAENLQTLNHENQVVLDEENQVVALIKWEQGSWRTQRILNRSY